jgi:hypothetical protein
MRMYLVFRVELRGVTLTQLRFYLDSETILQIGGIFGSTYLAFYLARSIGPF